MFYKILGWLVWTGGKTYLQKRNSWYLEKRVYAGVGVAALAAAALLGLRHNSADS